MMISSITMKDNRSPSSVALANNMACAGLDKMEEKLPILHQPSGKVVANASEAVVGAKDAVVQRITGIVDKTQGAVQDGVERTKAVVNGSISTVLGSGVGEMMINRVDAALSKSESLLERYLPPTDEELGKRMQPIIKTWRSVACDVEYTRKHMDDASHKIQNAQEKIYNKWLEWSKGTGQDASGDTECTEHTESRTLAIARNLSHQLQTTCLSLVTGVQGLPQTLQKRAQDVSAMAADVYQTFHAASSFREMSAGLLTTTKEQLANMKGFLEEVLDLLVNNSPLNWLIGGFNPQLAGSREEEQGSRGEESTNQEH
ncbi:hypothetical protein GDO78_014265 [Eleutherodactylus coqui]|uniref:Perilipin n=1 Tax=Eleutherodactylus coqui TaxID=57060 RepID=A0A8J6E6V8_ELECQ|nr:hypothetical protein GDO78_014265 [Eleutherodactylus coqui]